MDVYFEFPRIPQFAEVMKDKATPHLIRAMGKAFYRIGKSDIELMRGPGLADLKIRREGFRKSFKFKATDSREVKSVDELRLIEYTGAKPFQIFQTGGTIEPHNSHTLTILTDAARAITGRRKLSQKELKAMIDSGQAKIIQTKAGPAVVKIDEKTTKKGHLRKGSKWTILAWLKPKATEQKRLDFFANFDANASAHDSIMTMAADEVVKKIEEENK